MTTQQLTIATSTVWVIVAAVLVMFMQAGFAFLEAGLTRMKNVGHIAAKNVLIFALASARLLRRRVRDRVRRRRQRLRRRLGFLPVDRRPHDGRPVAVLVVRRDPGRRRLPVRGRVLRRLARDRLGRDGRADEALGLLRLRRRVHAHLLGRVALDLEPRRLAVLEGDAGLRRLDGRPLPGCARGARRRPPPRPADRQVRRRRQAERHPGPQHGVHDARRDHPVVRLVRLQPRLDALASTSEASASSPTSR